MSETFSSPSPGPRKVAIVGGGCGGVTAALELSHPRHEGRFDVTVYQMGWRLGGKGASGRGVNGRIEEHGLHLWLGFYENAFRLLRDCYDELDRDPATCPISSFEQAFTPDPWVSVTENTFDDDWQIWTARFPAQPGLPGDPIKSRSPWQFSGYLVRALRLVASLLQSIDSTASAGAVPEGDTDVDGLTERLDILLKVGQMISVTAVVEALNIAVGLVRWNLPGQQARLETLLERIQTLGHQHLDTLARSDDQLRRLWTVVDMVLACMRGIFRFDLYRHPLGFDAINDYEWREWLQLNGASRTTVDSAFVRGSCYDLTFAYVDGDTTRPALAAGVALRGAIRMFFTYRGSLFWKMNAGMGDIVFAPIYEVLKARGVRFEFFHKLTNVELGRDKTGTHVSGLAFDLQALTKTGGEYEPLVDINGLPCWPSDPLYSQLEGGDRLRVENARLEEQDDATCVRTRTLRVGRDYDFVVLAVSLGTIPSVCSQILDDNQRWRDMVDNIGTVATQALQVWMNQSMPALGYEQPAGNLSGFVSPFDTWADMTNIVAAENWTTPPLALAYFCSSLPEAQLLDADADQVVMQNAETFLNQHIASLWPGAVDGDGRFRTGVIVPDGRYSRSNHLHSERYVQSLPGSIRYRISPLDRDYDNLTIAGDWTHTGLDSGCVESAVMSGLLAAHAISLSPPISEIVGFDHP